MKSSMFSSMLLFILFLLTSCSKSGGDTPVEPPSLVIQNLSIEEGEIEKPIFIDIRISAATDEEVRFTIETESGTAEANIDFEPINSTEVVFAPGSTRKDVRVVINGDEEDENDEIFYLNISNIQGATTSLSRVEITIEDDDVDLSYDIPTTGYSTPTAYAGYKSFWADEFDDSALNENDWTFEIGNGQSGWGNEELQFYRKENTELVEGHLVIQAREEAFAGFKYTSSRIITQKKVSFTHGRVDIRAALPEGQGIWPALWMLGENISSVSWPRCGEIDIMEIVGHEPSKVHGTVHYPNIDGNHLYKGGSKELTGGTRFSDKFHVFSIIWKEDLIEWYLDDVKYFTVTPDVLGSANPYPFNEDFFFIMNCAVGGKWPGSPDNTTIFPQNLFVDYIRVFQEE